MDGTYNYIPKSPILDFLPSPTKPQHQYQQQQQQQQLENPSSITYAPRSPDLSSFSISPAGPALTSQHNLHSTYSNQQHSFGAGYGYGNPLQVEQNQNLDFAYPDAPYLPEIPALPPQHSFDNQQHLEPQYIPTYQSLNSYTESDQISTPTMTQPSMSSRQPRGKGLALASSQPSLQQQQYKDPNPNNIEIKTKFPVARIKRIMQADEEVGKVAQVTPVAVSKALELFMIALVSGAAEKAKEKGGKRVTAQHLKQVVLGSPEQFDFLADIVGRVAEVTEGAGGEGRKKRKETKEEGSESSEGEQKKVKKPRARKKKIDD